MFLKLAQILMVAVIFNPFCCCTAAAVMASDSAGANVVPTCCQSGERGTAPTNSEDHDPAECSHHLLKDYQNKTVKDGSAEELRSQATTILFALFTPHDSFSEPLAQNVLSIRRADASPAPSRALTELYCVYRI